MAIPGQNNSDKSVPKQLRLATISEDELFPFRNSGVRREWGVARRHQNLNSACLFVPELNRLLIPA